MASKKKGKGKKGKKKGRGKMRKFDLDYFGLLTFTRYYGAPFEEFMYTPDKKNKPKVQKAKGKKGKKGKKPKPEVPRLMKFPEVPEDTAKIRKIRRVHKQTAPDTPDAIITSMNVGYPEKTTRGRLPLIEGGSIRDVICKKTFPVIPRPLPHGGVYGNIKCVVCASQGGLLKTLFGMLHKKMRKLLNNQFDKARIFLNWAIEKMKEMSTHYLEHIQNILQEMGPILDSLDEQEWEDHQNVRTWKENFRKMQKELLSLRAELKKFRKHRDEQINARLAEKIKEMEEAERQMLALEAKVREAQEMLRDWTENKDAKIAGPKDEIERLKALLQKIKDSILVERDTLRALLEWEMKMATEKTIAKMEEIINQDLDVVQGWLHSAWFRLFLENRRMQEERSRLQVENHLLELEVEALTRQVGQMETNKRDIESTRHHFITPPFLHAQVDKFTKTKGGQYNDQLELWEYPPTKLIHE